LLVAGLGCRNRDSKPEASAVTAAVERVPPRPVVSGTQAERRAQCAFDAGDLPAETLDADMPHGAAIPIEHFVIVMQENRSFDHYFQKLPQSGQPDVDVAPPSYANPDRVEKGELVRPFPLRGACQADVPHEWAFVHEQLNGDKMDGFVAAANPEGDRALGYYGPDMLGYYYALANTFAIGDRYFAAFPGPTYPNRMFMLSASSFGHFVNTTPQYRAEERSIFHELEERKLEWAIYADHPTFEALIYPRLHAEKGHHFLTVSDFIRDAAAGNLPRLAWVESSYGGPDATDEHAPGNVQVGQAFVARVVDALLKSPAWPKSALVLTYDEHGGFFDHVPPPAACSPGDEGSTWPAAHAAKFTRLGVRVPLIVVSPFAKRHYVSHHTYSHTSVLSLIRARFDLPALSARDANDEPPYDLFDFTNPPFTKPPQLPKAEIDASERARCRAHSESQDQDLPTHG
jgi:phospholipase C